MKKKKVRDFVGLHPVISFVIMSAIVILLSFVFELFRAQSTYNVYSLITEDSSPVTEAATSLLNLTGLKYIFTTSVENFANFTVLSNLIIILIGIGIMDKSGFLETTVTLLTKRAKKTNVTFTIILICLLSSVIGDLSYIIFIPITAIIFYYGKRNPFIGIIASFAALTTGSGLSIIFTSIDSILSKSTSLNAWILTSNYEINIWSLVIINFIVIIAAAYLLTYITENIVAKKLPKYEFTEAALEEDFVTKKELRGMILAGLAGVLYLFIIVYNVIPGLPFSGNLLDNTQVLYIDKLFSYESFFSNGFVFIVAMFFVILGLIYGLGSGSIKNNKDVVNGLSHALDGIGKTLLLIFVASLLINIFKQTNIGNVIVVYLTNLINNVNFTGLPLVLLLFFVSMIATLFVPFSVGKWEILSTTIVPAFINSANLTPEFAQIVFRMGESVTMGLTPLLSFFIIYIAYIEKYNQSNKSIGILESIKYQIPYAVGIMLLYLAIIMFFYFINIPLGIGGAVPL